MIMPFFALAIFSWDSSLYIPGINIFYKHWRLFIVVCTTPGFICGLLLFILPESPKYLLSIGQDEEALRVLKKIYYLNSGKPKSTFPVKQVLQDKDTESSRIKGNYLEIMWSQTKPLFNQNHLRTTLLVCLMQFIVYAAGDGMYIWFPDIVNSVMENNYYGHRNESTICHIYDTKLANIFDGQSPDACVEKFEMSTYQYSLIVELIYLLGPVLYSFIIDRVGMICIICEYLFAEAMSVYLTNIHISRGIARFNGSCWCCCRFCTQSGRCHLLLHLACRLWNRYSGFRWIGSESVPDQAERNGC